MISFDARSVASSLPRTRVPEGGINLEAEISSEDASLIEGWTLFPSETVACVEISVDGRVVGRARPAVSRPDVARVRADVDAGLSGFEYWLEPADLPQRAQRIVLGARAVGTNGTTLELTEDAPVAHGNGASTGAGQSVAASSDRALTGLSEQIDDIISRAPRPRSYPLRLLAFTHHLGYGGAQLIMAEVLRVLRSETGCEITLVSYEDGALRDVVEALGIPVRIVKADRSQDPIRYERELLRMAEWAAPQGFNAVIANTIEPFLGIDLADRLGIPSAWLVHESYDPEVWWRLSHGGRRGGKRAYVWQRMCYALRTTSALVFASERTRQFFLSYGDPQRLITAPTGIMLDDIDRYRARVDRRQLRRRLDIADEAVVVLCLGTIEPRKGQTALAVAFSHVAQRFPGARLVLVGETEVPALQHISDELRRFSVRAGLESRLAVLPLTADPYHWLALADLLVLSSDIESLPRVVQEAMAFGVPVIGTSIFGVTDLIEDGRTGYLCEANDVGALRAALTRALQNDDAGREAMAQAAAESVRREHDARRYGRWIARLLHTLIARPNAFPSEVAGT